jgi:serine protease AprX
MKKITLLLFFSISCFSQTVSDRNKIIATYDFNKIAQLKSDAQSFYQSQKLLIEQYKKDHPFVESEAKSLQFIDNGVPLFFTVNNQGSAVTLSANRLYPSGSLGLNLSGTGMISGVWDGGLVRESHQELSGSKIIYGGDVNPNMSDHATHVSGTIIARGASPTRRGIAYDGRAITYSFADDYLEMFPFASDGYLVSNHSYGLIASGLTTPRFGAYDFLSVQMDDLANAFPYYQIVIAAGNDRDSFTLPQVINKGGYDLITGRGVSKNSIVVAAVTEVPNYIDNSSVTMSSFSNYGPTDDGRIKPDIAAKGVGVSSCTGFSDSSYATYQGTSMATPAISGMILLLQQHYNNLNPTNYMKAATVRGLICHSAREAGLYPGPDYEFGWGLGNAESAARIISGKDVTSVLQENTLNNGQVFTKQISITSTQNITATICWTDPTGVENISTDVDNRTPRLVNNLDLKILKDGITYYPWKLDYSDTSAGATNNSDNNVDNVEKVEIFNAPPGVYTIQVSHKSNLAGGSQNFSLIANGATGLSLNTRDYSLEDSIFVYPNPAKELLNFNVKNNIAISSIKINDISGKEVFANASVIGTTPINVSGLSSGVYFITFTTDSNSVTKKFIKQ